MYGATVLSVRRDSKVVMVADGQVTMGDHVTLSLTVRTIANGRSLVLFI
jgi:ATP-dependent protease HslVU (ClpYQ) peptidase subunit